MHDFETIDTPTLELLKNLFNLPVLKDMRLVGGTSLALQNGHQKSIDLGLYGYLKADELTVSEALKSL
jgi:hypothetical protein